MKISFVLGPRQPVSRQTAWGCLTTNLAFPGTGSLIAGRKVGYAQIPFYLAGLGFSLVATIQMFMWFGVNWARYQQTQDDDPAQSFVILWTHLKWPLIGIIAVVVAILWGLLTSLSIVNEARRAEREAILKRPLPPKLDGR